MGKIKEQVAALFGFKVKDEGDGQLPKHEQQASDETSQRRWLDDAQMAAKPAVQPTYISRIPNPSASKRPSAEQQRELPELPVQHRLPVGHRFPSPKDASSSALTAPLHVESATLLKLSASQRTQILQELLKGLQTGPMSSRAAAAESLFNSTSEDELSRQSISAMGAVKPLVELLKLDDVKGQMYAAYTLSALTSFDSSLADMRECHAIEALLQLLDSNVSEISKKGALRALGRLARVDECVSEMVDLSAIPILSRLLDSSDGTIVRRCLLTLYFIGADKLDMQDIIAKGDIVKKVVALSTSKQHEIQSEAVDVIKVLARSQQCASIIMREGGISILEDLAQNGPNAKARTCAVKALQRLAEIEDARQHIIETGGQPFLEAQAGGSEAASLATALKDTSDPEGQASACQAVIDAIREDHACAIHMADAGVIEALLPLLQSTDADTRDAVAVALAHIASHATARRRVWSAGSVSPLVRGLSTLGFRGVEGAAVCLEKLVALKEAAEQLASEPVLPGLLHAIRMGHAQASYFALRTLFLLSGVDSSLLAQLSSPENLALLSLRAWHGKPEAQSVALLLLRDLGRQRPKQVANISTGTVPLLIGLQSSPVPEVAQFAQETVQLLSSMLAVSEEARTQGAMRTFVEHLATNPEIPLSRTCERALRMLPRGLYHSEVPAEAAYSDLELSVLAGHATEPASIDVLILQKLRLAPGQRFLEIGSGSGYLTALAAYMVGSNGSATGVDISTAAVEYAREQCESMHKAGRFGHGAPAPRFLCRDGGTLLEVGELWDAVVVSGNVPAPWIKTLTKLCSENGRLIACVDEQLCLFEQASSAKDGQIIGFHKFSEMTLSRRRKLQQPAQAARKAEHKSDSSPTRLANRQRGRPGSAAAAPSAAKDAAVEKGVRAAQQDPSRSSEGRGLQPRLPGGSGLLAPVTEKEGGKGGKGEEDAQMQRVKQEIETEQMNGLLVTADDIEICRTPKGRKCRLGEGGFGVVYKALMNGVDEVAIKLVKAANPSAKDVEIFLTEVRTLSKLHHRNIVQFYGACLDPDRAMFFVTELMKGGDLYSALRHHPETMRWDKLGKKVALDVALGINYLHSRRPPLLHRDLKSPNVLLSEEGVAKIADVGMVRSQVKELVTAQPVMTPLWAAPEVMRHERASVKADIWSFGILIWELVTGSDITEYQPLAQSRQPGKSHKGKQMVLPSQCPPVALRVFRECTKSDPDDRPSSQDIVEWLRHG